MKKENNSMSGEDGGDFREKKLSGRNKGHEHSGNASIAYTAKARITAAGSLRPGSHYL